MLNFGNGSVASIPQNPRLVRSTFDTARQSAMIALRSRTDSASIRFSCNALNPA